MTSIVDTIFFYRVKNLERVHKLYGEILGFSLYKDQGKCLIYDTHGHGKIGFCSHFPKDFNPNTCITFVYQTKKDVDAMYQCLKDSGYTKEQPKINKEFGIYHFFIKDDQELNLEFQVFL